MNKRSKKELQTRSWQIYHQYSDHRSLYVVGFAFLCIVVSFLIVHFLSPNQIGLHVMFVAVLILQVAIAILMVLRKRYMARLLAAGGMWLFFTIFGLLHKDAGGVVLAGYLMVMIVTGFSLGPNTARRVFALSVIASLAFVLLDLSNIYSPPWVMPPSSVLYFIFAIILVMGSIYLDYTLQSLTKTLQNSQKYERRYKALFEGSQDAVLIMDLDYTLIEANHTGEMLFGVSQGELVGKSASELFSDVEMIEEVAEELLKNRQVSAFEHQIITSGGEMIDVESLPTLVFTEDEKPGYFQIILRDVRSRKKFESTLLEYRQQYQAMFDQIEYAFFLLSLDLKVVAANPKASDLTALPLKELIGSKVTDFITPEEHAVFRQNISLALGERHLATTYYTVVNHEGQRLWGETIFSVVENQENEPIYIQWIVRNVTGQRKREQELEKALNEMEALAMTDPLTGLRNRRSIQQFAMTALEESWVNDYPVSLILLDVDLLKNINDTYGHQAGDAALSHVAEVLNSQKRGDDAASRWAGDEFLVVLPDTDLAAAELAAIRFGEHIERKTLTYAQKEFNVGVCLGVAGTESLPPGATLSFNLLLQMADNALYDAKTNGRNGVVVAGREN